MRPGTSRQYTRATLSLADLLTALELGLLTLARVAVLIALASVVWVPIGIWIGLRPRVADLVQPRGPVPGGLSRQCAVSHRRRRHRLVAPRPDIWLSPLMVLGTQWYILFNVIAGASAFPTDLREVSTMFRLRTWQWWRQVMLPGILPYYVTGALTAAGGSWNASIVAEVASWGDTKLQGRRPRLLHRRRKCRRRLSRASCWASP